MNRGWNTGYRKLWQRCLEAIEHGPSAGQKANTDLKVQRTVLG